MAKEKRICFGIGLLDSSIKCKQCDLEGKCREEAESRIERNIPN